MTVKQPQQLNNRGIANAALLVMAFFVLSRVTGLAREIVIGAQFGTNADLDAYLAAFRVPDLLFQLVAGGALGSAFIPTFSDYMAQKGQARAWLLFSQVLNLITLILVILAALAAMGALPLVRWIIAPGFPLEQQMLTADLMRWMLLSTIVFGASGLIMGALNANQHFLYPAAAPIFYNVAILLGAWLLAPYVGIYGVVIGVVIGAASHLLIQLPALFRQQMHYTPSLSIADPGVREVARLMGPRMLGLFFVQMHFLVNTILASGLAPGSLSALNYAWLLMLLPQGVFAQAVATAVFPTFANQVAAKQTAEMRHTFSQTLRMVFFLTIPAAVVLYVLRVPLVQVLLQRGEFTADSTALVAYALQFYALGLVAHAGLEIVVRAFYALHDTMTPVIVGVGAMLLNIGLSFLWVSGLGHGGLALANSVATGLELLLLLWLLRKRMNGIEGYTIVQGVVRCSIAAAVMGLLVWLGRQGIEQSEWAISLNQGGWLAAVGGVIAAGLLYLLCSLLLKSEELQPALALILRRRS